jgi:oligopeptide/dipeptide ABC transporter ATP-binding protein
MRITDVFLAFPILVSLLVLRNVLAELPLVSTVMGDKTSVRFMVILLSAVGWMAVARIVRGVVLSLKEREFVEASRSVGASGPRIMFRHLIPNALGPIMVSLSLSVVGAILAESTLSFFGYGPSPGEGRTTWGLLIAQSKKTVLSGYWWLVVFPCAFLVVTIVCINFVGDGLRDAFDPKSDEPGVTDEQPVLEIRDLRVTFPTESGLSRRSRRRRHRRAGEMLGVVGESGSGKSVTFLAAMGLLPKTATIEGSVKVHGHELIGMNNNEMRKQRGKRISMIFQDPLSALNPTHRIGHQISRWFAVTRTSPSHRRGSGDRIARARRHPAAANRVSQYPTSSPVACASVMIAIAIANDPDVLIADEPTTALDVTVQAQILDVIQNIQHKFRASVVFITHDLGVVARIADRVQVMYAGRTVELGDVESIFRNPTHPYTRGLLASLPALGRERLTPIPGAPPNMLRPPSGCAFRPRCPYAEEICAGEIPELRPVLGLQTACVRAEELLVVAGPT